MKRTQLIRRTPLIARTPLRSASTLTRTKPLPTVQPKLRTRRDTLPRSVRLAVQARADGLCEACGMGGPDHIHHRQLRSQGGQHVLDNLIHVHHGCHEQIHANPTRSYALGLMVRRGVDPATVPVQMLRSAA